MAGLRGRCPRCGEGALYQTFLGLREACPVCGLDYSRADAGDGPAVFVMSFVGFVTVVAAFIARFTFGASIGASFAISGGLAVALTLALLRPLKATLIALQHHHKAEEGRPVATDPSAR
ncbi:MAG: DUF983 domain-containing protein [Parvularculaceae bacterium]